VNVFQNPAANLDTITQIFILVGVVLNVILGLARRPCDFILQAMLMVVKLAMSVGHPGIEYNADQKRVLKQLPCSIRMALKQLNVEGDFTIYVTCPSCHYTHAPKSNTPNTYPAICNQMIPDSTGMVECGAQLLQRSYGRLRPIKPYIVPSFTEYLSRVLSDPEAERLCDEICDEAMERLKKGIVIEDVRNVFEAVFLQKFKGPTGTLFIDRRGKIRLAVSDRLFWPQSIFEAQYPFYRSHHLFTSQPSRDTQIQT
jgi:hypothetical protein